MTVELVDGRAGTPHISGDDLGDFKAGFIGSDGYVLKRGDNLAATLDDANHITIATGSAIMPVSGRHVRVPAPETLDILSGTQGQKCYDLVVLRPVIPSDNTSPETAQLVVLHGTPTSSTPVDPEYEDTDLPLYRIIKDGISVDDPIPLFDVLVPYSEFRSSIDPVVLYDNPSGTKSDFSLSQSVENFDIIEIFFFDDVRGSAVQDSTRMAVGYGSNAVILASADRVLINTRIIQLASRVLVFSGASATFNEEFFINGTLGSGTVVSNMASGSHIGVFKIIGYRNN